MKGINRWWRLVADTTSGLLRGIAAYTAAILTVAGRSRPTDRLVALMAAYAMRSTPQGRLVAETDRGRLLQLLHQDQAARRILLGIGAEKLPLRSVLHAAREPELIQLVAVRLTQRNTDSADHSELLYETIALGAVTAGQHVVGAALIAVSRVPELIQRVHAEGILRYCLQTAAQSPSPYDRNPTPGRARAAAVNLIREHPELDGLLAQQMPDAGTIVREIIASGLRGRSDPWPAFVKMLAAWRPTAVDACLLAEDADPRRQARTAIQPTHSARFTVLARVRYRLRLIAPWLLAPTWAGAVWRIASTWHLGALAVKVDLAATLAILALLVTVHVVAAELAADRLPGLLARFTSVPPALAASYGAAGGLIVVALAQGEHPYAQWTWVTVFLIAAFLYFVFLVMRQLVRRTDSATAATVFVDYQRAAYAAAGRYLGVVQRHAIDDLAELEDMPHVRVVTTPVRTVNRASILAPRRGFLLVHAKRLHRLGRLPAWSSGGFRLNIVGGLGTVVNEGREVASIVPDFAHSISPRDIRMARRCLEFRSVRAVEEVAEAAASLVEMAAKLARGGDKGGAERASREILVMLRAHLHAERSAQDIHVRSAADSAPVVPAVHAAIHSVVGHLRDSQSTVEDEVLCALLEAIVDLGRPSEAAVAIACSSLSRLDGAAHPVIIARILLSCGIRCLETDDDNGLIEVWSGISQRLFDLEDRSVASEFLSTASELAGHAPWINYSRAIPCWRRYWNVTAKVSADEQWHRAVMAMPVGAAALLAGFVSVATAITLDLRKQFNLDAVCELVTQPQFLARLELLSSLSSGFLGDSPADAVTNFGKFASQSAAAIATE